MLNSRTWTDRLCGAPAWWGFAGEGDRQRLERLITRMRLSGYLPSDFPDLATLIEEADCKLYTNVLCTKQQHTRIASFFRRIAGLHSPSPKEGSQLCPSTQRQ